MKKTTKGGLFDFSSSDSEPENKNTKMKKEEIDRAFQYFAKNQLDRESAKKNNYEN